MKRPVLIALFFAFMLSLSATVSFAEPGCDKDGGGVEANSTWSVMQNDAKAEKVKQNAYTRQIIKRNDPAAGMTCLDKALGVTARLGTIFSDQKKVTAGLTSSLFEGADVADGLTSILGVDSILASNLNKVVSPVLGEYVNDFMGTLGSVLGTSSISSMLNDVVTAINAPLAAFNTVASTVMGIVSTVDTTLSTINNFMHLLSLPITIGMSVKNIIEPAVKAARDAIKALMDAITGPLIAAIQDIMNELMTALASDVDMTCDRVKDLWDDGDDTAGADSIEGNGIQEGAPYYTTNELLYGAPDGATEDLLNELNGTYNSGILSNALNDMQNLLDAPGAGKMPAWKERPTFPADFNLAGVIGAM